PDLVFPFNLPFVSSLNVVFRKPVAFFVGENGTGKSTLLEAMAVLCKLPVSGGGRNEASGTHGPERESALSRAIRPSFRQQPRDGFFLRAEFAAHFASLLDERRNDPDFLGDPYSLYGGKSLHARSHGEAFLAILQNRIQEGLFLLDEPESALSPQRQLALLALIHSLVDTGECQFVVATHSPILLTYPDAQIISFDTNDLRNVTLEETSHYQVTRGILDQPERYWKHLIED
ncbi:MAG TPA: AAA family ATPase, partial [Acidobacteriaceae bacterium]|nr:AAA family ATPase [Acidobacteriaceae bacterium]